MFRFHSALFQVLFLVHVALAAFTQPTSYLENTVKENAQGAWCWYPQPGETSTTVCGPDFSDNLYNHLETTVSIGYYGLDGTRYGGAEWSVPAMESTGNLTLCVSGRADDGTYQTACMFVVADNSLPISRDCWVDMAQAIVTDGCYVPEQFPTASPSSSPPPAPTIPPSPPPTPSFDHTALIVGVTFGIVISLLVLVCLCRGRRCAAGCVTME